MFSADGMSQRSLERPCCFLGWGRILWGCLWCCFSQPSRAMKRTQMDDLESLVSPLSLGMWTGLHEMHMMCWVQASQRASLPRGRLLLPHYWETDGRSLSMCSEVGSSSHRLHKQEFHLSECRSSLESSLVLTRSVMISYHFSLHIQGLYLWFSILSLRPILCHLCVAKVTPCSWKQQAGPGCCL